MTAASKHVAVIGAGRHFESAIAPTLLRLSADPAIVIDPDPVARQRVTQLAASLGASKPEVAERLSRRLVRDLNIDAVIIASPHGTHYGYTHDSLSLGVATFLEKPLACNPDEAAALVRIATRAPLRVSEQRIYRPDMRALRHHLRSGVLGTLQHITYIDRISPTVGFAESWRNDPRQSGGGVLMDLGYHTIATVLWLLPISERYLHVDSATIELERYSVEDRATLRCSAASGTGITIEVELSGGPSFEEVAIAGNKGTARLIRHRDTSEATIEIEADGLKVAELFPTESTHEEFGLCSFLQRPRNSLTTLNRHADVVQLIRGAYATVETGVR